ncbi:hypothetical protein BSN82_04525 [Acinetobacter baylyi]|mgnify:CR=1 FL=1|nr:hypothetical protein [Acinetobacter sp.]ENV54110.1 hypothetical protein F952_02165 [Acinetobacter baylyi DSM 14961 = CIP 107474]KAF2373028.1 hypothetical protein BSL88_02395 [Acinetobacter baylyi]KAF2375379.1 hypothetical protein BSL67_03525 [Acinetobacter baylyi]KAF2376059.1 hypothetical protein BSN81_14675 [Acinetobacter baylyi]KAF2382807.1 hypothetical protein BSN83_02565 [Acinetobacter baylyi]
MTRPESFAVKGYLHRSMMKAAYLWLPFFAIIILICSYFENYRFMLYGSVVALTYSLIIQSLKKKTTDLQFTQNAILIGQKEIQLSSVKNYNISLALNRFIILRIQTQNENEAVYIDQKEDLKITQFLSNALIPKQKQSYDYFLQYDHLILPFVGLIICALMYKLSYYIQYGF